jgi:hypothetical protein
MRDFHPHQDFLIDIFIKFALNDIGFQGHGRLQRQAFTIGADALLFQLHLYAVQRLLYLGSALSVGQVLGGLWVWR